MTLPPSTVACVRVRREADDGDGAAVEVVGADDDLGFTLGHAAHLIAPLAHRLDCRFDGFGARIHRQDLVRAGKGSEFLIVKRELVVAERSRRNCEPARLLGQRRQDLRMAMALIDGGIRGEAIEITVAVYVPDPDALAATQHHIERLVVLSTEPAFTADVVDLSAGNGLRPFPAAGKSRNS